MNAPSIPLLCPPPRRAALVGLLFVSLSALLHAQDASQVSAAELAKYDKNKNGKLDADELAALEADRSKRAKDTEVVTMSTFEVNTQKDDGFVATSMGTGGRLNMDMKDVAAPFSSMTRELIDVLNITNLVEATTWSTNGAPVPDGQGVDMFGNPNLLNTRGQIQSTNGQRNFAFSASLMDSYNLERYEFGRGPNAGLFNINNGSNENPLAGGISATSKKPRLDRAFANTAFTTGSWNYYRGTIDVNQPLSDKFAVRGNGVWFDRRGWRLNEFEKVKGITTSATYLPFNKTQISFEGLAEVTERSLPNTLVMDKLSGWDGSTVFAAPITDAQRTALQNNGANQGVDRRGGLYYVFVPGQGAVMNRQNEGLTLRGDENANVPLYSNGVANYRGTGQPFGNGGNNNANPGLGTNPGDDSWFIGEQYLPGDRFDRAINNSAFRIPSRRFTYLPDHPVFEQHNKDFNGALTHQFNEGLISEVGWDFNRTHDARMQNTNSWRQTRIDINRNLPDGTPNPYFLQPYGDSAAREANRYTSNAMVRFNLGWEKDLGRWGSYHFVLNALSNTTRIKDRDQFMSTAEVSDARLWANGVLQIQFREYWNNPARPYNELGDVPSSFSKNLFDATNNLTSTLKTSLSPKWALGSWSQTSKKNNGISLPMSARYTAFARRLVLTLVPRFDSFDSRVQQSPNFADLPSDWDGKKLYFKPDAPSDWYSLTYLTKDANGNPTVKTPLIAASRPRVTTTVASVSNTNLTLGFANPIYAKDRFRDDYNPPAAKGHSTTGSYGFVYGLFPWADVGGNYANTYSIPPTNAFDMNNEQVAARMGFGYDASVRLHTRDERFSAKLNYYYNVADHARFGSSVVDQANNLLSAQPAANSVSGERNTRNIQNFPNTDYQSQSNKGYELEVAGRITRGLRLMINAGSAKQANFDQYLLTPEWLKTWDPTLQTVLQDAGGMLTGGTQSTGAPGLAVANPAITPANATQQTNAINAYNNMWANYANVVVPARGGRQNVVTLYKANFFADYTVQEGRFKAVRLGFGAQWRGGWRGNVAGTRVGQSTVNAAGQVVDDPTVDSFNNVYVFYPLNTTGSIGYKMKLFKRDVDFQLNIRNLFNGRAVIYQDSGITLRPPGGNLSVPYRVAVPTRVADYQQPISFLFTTRVNL